MNALVIDGNKVRVGGKEAVFKYPVKEAAEVKDIVVVVLDKPKGETMTENVFGIAKDGTILWQIEKIPETSQDPVNSYMGVVKVMDDVVRIGNWNDVVVEVDVSSGKIVGKRFARFT